MTDLREAGLESVDDLPAWAPEQRPDVVHIRSCAEDHPRPFAFRMEGHCQRAPTGPRPPLLVVRRYLVERLGLADPREVLVAHGSGALAKPILPLAVDNQRFFNRLTNRHALERTPGGRG